MPSGTMLTSRAQAGEASGALRVPIAMLAKPPPGLPSLVQVKRLASGERTLILVHVFAFPSMLDSDGVFGMTAANGEFHAVARHMATDGTLQLADGLDSLSIDTDNDITYPKGGPGDCTALAGQRQFHAMLDHGGKRCCQCFSQKTAHAYGIEAKTDAASRAGAVAFDSRGIQLID